MFIFYKTTALWCKRFNHRGHRGTRRGRLIIIENKITEKIISCAIEVHKQLGPGLLESAYQECLYYELQNTGLDVKKQLALPLVYKDIKLDAGYRIDLLVENKVIV